MNYSPGALQSGSSDHIHNRPQGQLLAIWYDLVLQYKQQDLYLQRLSVGIFSEIVDRSLI